MDAPKVVIVIPNWNGKEILKQCLESLYERTNYPVFSVVVVDNGSSDGSVSMLQEDFPETEVIENSTNRGFSKANNQGFSYALERDAAYVLMLNNDIIVEDPDWLATLVDTAEMEPEIGVASCRIVNPDGSVEYDGRWFPRELFLSSRLRESYQYNVYELANADEQFTYVDEVVGAVVLIDRAVLEDVGQLDETFSPVYYEETDYCVRVWDAGYRIAYTNQTWILHKHQQTSSAIDSSYLASVRYRNYVQFVLLNYPLHWIFVTLPYLLKSSLNVFGEINISEREFTIWEETKQDPAKSVLHLLTAYIWLLKNLPSIVRKRRGRDDVRSLLKIERSQSGE